MNCTKYASQIKKEAYLTEKTVNSNWKITSVPIRSTGKKKLYFTGSGRPKKGVMIQFRLNLNGYGDGNPATISGQMSGNCKIFNYYIISNSVGSTFLIQK